MLEETLKDMKAVENLTNKFCNKLFYARLYKQDCTKIIKSLNCLNFIYELLCNDLEKTEGGEGEA